MQSIDRTDLQDMMQHEPNLRIVEVLDAATFAEFHIPGAINVPMGDGFDERIQAAVPGKVDPVVVYCMDSDCDASPRAGKRMEQLGYRRVLDYEAGKVDWRQADLPLA